MKKLNIVYFVLVLVFSAFSVARADDPKGQYGRVSPIADNNHPNLYYNQSEVDELRNMILVQRSPAVLYNLYVNSFRNSIATPQPYPGDYNDNNFHAAVSYMIEPTSAKADAIKIALYSYKNAYPNALMEWADTAGCHFCGYWLPWFFDLLMAYNPEKLSAAEIVDLKAWFKRNAEALIFYKGSKDPCVVAQSTYECQIGNQAMPQPETQEGKTVFPFPNWYSRYLGTVMGSALVSGDQAIIDGWSDSGWPHNLLTLNGVTSTYPSDTAFRYDLIMNLLSIYPSGANTDTYNREGYNSTQGTWNTVDYTWGGYHFAQMIGTMMAAEMVYHNGMTGVFNITGEPGTEPALLRTYKRSILSRSETDLSSANFTGRPIVGYMPENLLATRRYSDPIIENAVSGILNYNGPGPQGKTSGRAEGYDVPTDILHFFSYPRRVLFSSNGTIPPSGSNCPNIWNSSAGVPANFGAAFNWFSGAKELLMNVYCSGSTASASVGKGSAVQYIYKTGYTWANNQWSPFNYSGSKMDSGGNWFIGSANHSLGTLDLTQKQSVLAYICEWNGTSWKCGCNTSACTTNYWNLQQFKQ